MVAGVRWFVKLFRPLITHASQAWFILKRELGAFRREERAMGLLKSATAAFVATLSIAFLPSLSQAALVLPAAADAEIREDAPETPRGVGAPATTGGQTELAVRSGGGQNRWSIVRFDLTGLTAADVGAAADLRLSVRGTGWLNNQAGGVRVFGLNPTAPLQLWNEQAVIYRDAGDAIPVSPTGGHPGSQPLV